MDENYGKPPSWLAESHENRASNQGSRSALPRNNNRSRMNPNAPAFRPRPRQHARHPFGYGGQHRPREAHAGPSQPSLAVGGITEDSDESRRVHLMEAFDAETYECMVCIEKILRSHKIWSCIKCFHSFHLHCVKKWAASCITDEGWRCPGCQNMTDSIPEWYLCFCGKMEKPNVRRGDILVHSCGGVCGRSRGNGCTHFCSLYCHPGPCPPCPRTIQIECNCKREKKHVRCGTANQYKCSKICDKSLACGIHKCPVVCHAGPCAPCQENLFLTCHCGRSNKQILCSTNVSQDLVYSCGELCSAKLECGEHVCLRPCHPGPCGVCPRDPNNIQRCPCGKSNITDLTNIKRERCTDPIPLCNKTCDKVLGCGQKGKHDRCKSNCHEGDCPPCNGSTPVRCRCGAMTKSIPCLELSQYDENNPVICEKRCKKNRDCGRHKCGEVCCIDREHICAQICAKLLQCAMHRCTRLCHIGRCSPCLQASFEELSCDCGHSVRYPPIPCGGAPPTCDQLCSRAHHCDHPINHRCHSEPQCPPCTQLTKKWCFGKHELRSNIPCFEQYVSCGRKCDEPLSCGLHKCIRYCHAAPCELDDQACKQACPSRRQCGHACNLPCHVPQPCPPSQCSFMVKVGCKCGARAPIQMSCAEAEKLWSKLISTTQVGHELDLQAIKDAKAVDKQKSLPCNDDCAKQERNRRLAQALSVRCPDLAAVCHPVYTDFLKNIARSDISFVVSVEKLFVEIILDLEKSKTLASKSHMFSPMERWQRQFIHTYAEYFLIETVSYDPEPFRTVHVTAKKGRSAIPLVLLSKSTSIKPESRINTHPVVPMESLTSWCPEESMQAIKSTTGVARKPPSPPPAGIKRQPPSPPPDDWSELESETDSKNNKIDQ